MNQFIGQKEILNQINSLSSLPHNLLIEGPKGSGKHTICHLLSHKLGIDMYVLTEASLTYESLEDLNANPAPYLYVLDIDTVSMKKQNNLLKTLEENAGNYYLALLCENISASLPTIRSRCVCWKLTDYSQEELKLFADSFGKDYDPAILEIARVPGDVCALIQIDLQGVAGLINNIVDNIGKANYANILILPEKISNFSKTGTIDFDIFLKIFLYIIRTRIHTDPNIKLRQIYFRLQDLYKLHKSAELLHLNEQQLYERFLFDLKVETR